MKQLFFIGAMLLTLFVSGESLAQNAQASEYMNTISTKYRTIQEGVWDYTSTVAHGKSAKKVESTRTSLIQTTFKVLNEVKKMPDFEGDAAYRDSVASFLNIYYLILKEDYAKIVDMEEISERSYNDMEAYMNAKEAANVKMNNAADMVAAQQRIFAEKHGITLVEAKDDLSENMRVADAVYEYYNVLYLIFFKSYVQEKYLLEAINNKDVSGIEQNKNALIAAATEGLEALKKVESFKGDNTVAIACTEILTFYKDEAENKIPLITDYYIKTENFNTIKTSFDALKPNDRTQAKVDEFNKAVNEMNAAVNVFNTTNAELGTNRKKYLDNWNNSSAKFTDKHIPKK
jgi:hypothetical protein